MIWGTVQFDWPIGGLLALGVLPLLWGFYFLSHYRKAVLGRFASPEVLETVVEKRIASVYWIKTGLFCLAWVCAVAALMQPQGNERFAGPEMAKGLRAGNVTEPVVRKKRHDVILAVDVSASMALNDLSERKRRLDAAKEIADGVISMLKGENVALWAFTSVSMPVVPLTLDYLFTRLMVRQLEINEGETEGTNLLRLLEGVKEQFLSTMVDGKKTVILLSDGGDTSLEGLEGEKRDDAIEAIVQPVAQAAGGNVQVLVVGIGSKGGTRVPDVTFEGKPVVSALETPLLKRLSIVGRGQYWDGSELPTFEVVRALAGAIAEAGALTDEEINEARFSLGTTADPTRVFTPYFQLPLAIALLALACCFLIPDTFARRESRS